MEIYQSLVAVEPLTLIATICNLFVQLFIVKKFFLDKIMAVIEERRKAADQQINDAEAAKAEASQIKETYEKNMMEAKAQAEKILETAQKNAVARSEAIIVEANQRAADIRNKASEEIAQEKKKAINDAKNEISDLAVVIAGKIVERELNVSDQEQMINRFIDELGE